MLASESVIKSVAALSYTGLIMLDMYIKENVPLSQHSTMRLGGKARYLVDVHDKKELLEAVTWARDKSVPFIMIGEGSNIVWRDEGYDGLVIVNKMLGFGANEKADGSLEATICSGENWDKTVKRCVDLGYSGIEQLSLIPGTVGATPVQNVGAYGREIKDVLEYVEAYDTKTDDIVIIPGRQCDFKYRSSRFKTTDRGRFLIISISLRLTKTNPKPPFYDSLQKYLDKHNINEYTPSTIREAVIAIRQAKMPDPHKVANNGSFFSNPIIESDIFTKLCKDYPTITNWQMPDGRVKISAAWLIENSGFCKDYHDKKTGMGLWQNQALVLVNESAHTTKDLIEFKDCLVSAVKKRFKITLEQEPELI